jgi:putative two-component system response regulator
MDVKMGTILVVDDTPANLRLLAVALTGRGYQVRAAPSGEAALRMAAAETPDMVLLDVNMPDMDGYAVCDRFKATARLRDVPVLFISATNDTQSKLRAFYRGGLDYITKPFHLEEVFARVATHMELRMLRKRLQDHNSRLSHIVADQVREISDSQVATIVALAKLAERRDDDTGAHIDRIGAFVSTLAMVAPECATEDPRLHRDFVGMLARAAALHDIGKVGVPDAILLKPGKLTPEEFDTIKTHTTIGHETLQQVLDGYPGNEMLRIGAQVARWHHEKWDGSGYPDRLAGTAIPLAARLVAVADVYDALRSRRPYKEPFSHEDAARIIREGRGRHFDPALVDAFVEQEGEFEAIWMAFAERPVPMRSGVALPAG